VGVVVWVFARVVTVHSSNSDVLTRVQVSFTGHEMHSLILHLLREL